MTITVDETKPTDTEEVEKPDAEAEGAATATQQAEAEAKAQAEAVPGAPKPGEPEYTRAVQRRIDQLTREKHEAKRESERLKAEAEAWKRKAEAGARPLPPDPASFTNEDGAIDRTKYQRAMADYEDKLHAWRQAQAGPAPKADEAAASTEAGLATFLERAQPLKEKHADFEQVVNQPLFTPEMAAAIYDSEQGPEIAYFLGRNPTEANRIGGLAPAQVLREIGRLEARFASNPKAVSSAPPPITPVTGTAGAPKDPEKMTTAEWMAWDKQNRLEKLKQNPLGL